MADTKKERGFPGDERDEGTDAQAGMAASPVAGAGRAGTRSGGGRAAGAGAAGTARGTQQDNETLVRQLYEAFNDRDFQRTDELVADNFELISVAFGQTFRGTDGQRRYMQDWAAAFPDGRIEVTRVIDGGDSVAVEFTGRGTHTGPLRGPAGEIAPTRKRAEVRFCDVHEIERSRIARTRVYFDSATMLRQLGLIA